MNNETLLEQILVYTGADPYIKTLQAQLIGGNSLNTTQILLAKRIIQRHAIKSDDKALLPKPLLKAIPVDWTKYAHRMPFDFQQEGIQFLMNKDRAILADEMGVGKEQSLDSLLMTPFGWKRMGDIKVGDFVVGSDGEPTKVLGVFPQGEKEIYKVTFNDGSSTECGLDHLWAIQTPYQKWVSKKQKVKSLKEIMSKPLFHKNKSGKLYQNFIPMLSDGISFDASLTKQEFLIDPYLLGCLLGDGGLSQQHAVFTSADQELVNTFNDLLPKDHLLRKKTTSEYDHLIVSNTKKNLVVREVKSLGLQLTSHYKFIPNIYKFGTKETRKSVIQGLFDTDGGSCLKINSSSIEYSTVSQLLANDIKFILQSLGCSVKVNTLDHSYRDNGCLHYRVQAKFPCDFIPFRLSRKVSNFKKFKKKQPHRCMVSIEPLGKKEAQCIAVDAVDHLYVTDDCIITHNTTTAIVAALELGVKKVLIVCPNTLKYNWKKEFEFYTNASITIIDKEWVLDTISVINYDKLAKFAKQIEKSKFELVIADEAHYLKGNSKRFKTFCKISNRTKRLWLLTGTPIANRPIDFYNLLKLCKHELGQRKTDFVPAYCGGVQTYWGYQTDGASNLKQLHYKTQDVILRRTKAQVLTLPPKTRQPVYLQLDNMKGYQNAIQKYYEQKFTLDLDSNDLYDLSIVENFLVELSILRQFTALEKINDGSTTELIDNCLDANKKVIVYTNYRAVIDALVEKYKDQILFIDGRVTPEDRQKNVDLFQNNSKYKIIVCNYKAASTGITLTAADTMIMNDLDWSPANVGQAEDRFYRIGQDKSVTVLYPLYQDTIEDMMFSMFISKFQDISLAVDGKETAPFDKKELYKLLKNKK